MLDRPARQRPRRAAFVDGGHAIDEDVPDTRRIMVWLCECRFVDVLRWVEYDDIRSLTGLQIAAILQAQDVCRQSAGAADRLFDGQNLVLQRIPADFASECPIAA